jgi:4-carboxymuconolactone decarboxylase
MYLPKLYKDFTEKYPKIHESYQQLSESCRSMGPVQGKIQDLVMLGIAVGANSRGGVMSHTRKALSSGATPEEITHVIFLSLTSTGFTNTMAAMTWASEVFEKEKL